MDRNVWVYSCMVAALVRRLDVAGALCMVDTMREDGVTPNTVVFNTLLQAYADSETTVARVRAVWCLWYGVGGAASMTGLHLCAAKCDFKKKGTKTGGVWGAEADAS